MAQNKKIKTALVSVFYKDGLDKILALLNENGVKFLSTGGTQSFIQSLGYECDAVEDLTGYPSLSHWSITIPSTVTVNQGNNYTYNVQCVITILIYISLLTLYLMTPNN